MEEVTQVAQRESCGTSNGYNRHKYYEEDPCAACKRGKSEYAKKRYKIPSVKLKKNLASRAQSVAKTRLTQEFPDLYRAYYLIALEEKYREAGISRD